MSVTLRQPLTLAECETIRQWRNDPSVFPMLRTGYKTKEQQEAFYWQWIWFPWYRRLWWWLSLETRLHRYYAVLWNQQFIGMGGLTFIHQDQAEITLVLGPAFRGHGFGGAAVDALLLEAWRLGLTAVVGECYKTGATKFWSQQVLSYPHACDFYYDDRGSLHWRWEKPSA